MPTDRRGRPARSPRGRLWALLLLAAAAPATAQAPDTLGVSEWPLDAGDTWVYRARHVETRGDAPAPAVEESVVVRVLAAHGVGTERLALVERRRSGQPPEIEYHRLAGGTLTIVDDPDRLARARSGAPIEPDDPRAAVVFPLRDGQRWGAADMLARTDGLYISRVERPERLRLPAGEHAAFPVHFRTLPDQVTSWYAPGLGLVRWEYRHHGLDTEESWELLDFTHAPVDTAALTAELERRLVGFLSRDGFWSRREALADDPVLLAGLGALAIEEDPEDADGVRRLRLVGDRGRVSIERIPDGPGRAWIVAIGDREREWRRFEFATDRAAHPAAAWGALLADTRAELARALHARDAGQRDAASLLADRAMTRFAAAVAGFLPAAPPDSVALLDAARAALRAGVGNDALVTRFGRRARIDAGGLRADLEPCAGGLLLSVRYESPQRARIGAAPRLLLPGQAPRVVADLEEEPSLSPCRLLSADWAPERPGAECLFLCSDRPGGAPRVELYAIEGHATPLVWSRTLPGGSARLTAPDLTLEVDFERPDPRGSGVQRWREYWGPPPADPTLELYPRPIRRERLDPPAERPATPGS